MDETKEILLAIKHAVEVLGADVKSIKDRQDHMEREMQKRFDNVEKRFNEVDERFNEVDERFNEVDKRFNNVDSELRHIKRRLNRQDTDLDAALDRIELIENRLNPGDSRLLNPK